MSKLSEAFESAVGAARDGVVARLRTMLAEMPELLRARDDRQRTLLELACRAATGDVAIPAQPGTPGQQAAVDCLLAAGADPNAESEGGWRPLLVAAMAGHTNLAGRLLAAGAERGGRMRRMDGGTPLSIALFYGHTDTARVLATPADPDNLRSAAGIGTDLERFWHAGQLTSQASVGMQFPGPDFFPERSVPLNDQRVLDEALSWAARNDQIESMATLVERGANVNANPFRGTALLWAAYADRVAAARWLLDHGADPDLRHDFGGAGHGEGAVAMHLAAQFGSLACLRLLLERGADPTVKDAAHDGTPLGWAEFEGSDEAAAILREALVGR